MRASMFYFTIIDPCYFFCESNRKKFKLVLGMDALLVSQGENYLIFLLVILFFPLLSSLPEIAPHSKAQVDFELRILPH